MGIKASGSITLSTTKDISSTWLYYLLRSSSLAAPTIDNINVRPPKTNNVEWDDTEPSYTPGSTNSLYTVECTVFSDNTISYSSISRSSSYEAAKQAYNLADASMGAATDAAKSATDFIEPSTVGQTADDCIKVFPKAEKSNPQNYVQIDSDSVDIVKGGQTVAEYSQGLTVWSDDGTEIAHLGYGSTQDESGTTTSPYYNLGIRQSDTTKGAYSVAEGRHTTASASDSHAEGYQTTASGYQAHAEGWGTTASGIRSHAEGERTIASGKHTHAEGVATTASNSQSHAEGYLTTASGISSHAEGESNTAIGSCSHAEGFTTTANTFSSHAEGARTTANGQVSHAEGYYATADGQTSHAEGWYTTASGSQSHAEGYYTIASSNSSHVQGEYNVSNTRHADIVGNGKSDSERSNAYALDWHGNGFYKGDVYVGCKYDSTGGTKLIPGTKGTANYWEYIKYADGTFEAWRTYTTGSTTLTNATNGAYSYTNWSSISAPNLNSDGDTSTPTHVQATCRNGGRFVSAYTSDTYIFFKVYACASVSTAQTYKIDLHIRGTWS